jgi:hypothetical protein
MLSDIETSISWNGWMSDFVVNAHDIHVAISALKLH